MLITTEIKTKIVDGAKIEITYSQHTELFYTELYTELCVLIATGSGESLELAIADLDIIK